MIFLTPIFPRRFENVDGAFDVDALVKCRFLRGWAARRAGGQMDDLIELHAAEQFIERAQSPRSPGRIQTVWAERLDVVEISRV